MSSYDDYDDDLDPYLGHEYDRMDSPQSDWSELETPASDEVNEDIGIATEGDSMVHTVGLAKIRGASP
jgi:hypothetical protein